MNDNILKTIGEHLGNAAYGNILKLCIPDQQLPTENVLLSRFNYKAQVFNNVVRMAEVEDGLIIKLPLIPAMKLPFEYFEEVVIKEKKNKTHITLKHFRSEVGLLYLSFPTLHKPQFPRLTSLQTVIDKQMEVGYTDDEFWKIMEGPLPGEAKKQPKQFVESDQAEWISNVARIGLIFFVLYMAYSMNLFNF